ncbi:MAG: ECF-type sigma factor [Steroidobacteraceae bacterium]
MNSDGDLTDLIRRAQHGEDRAVDALYAAVYPELRRMAHARLRGASYQALLGTTELVHESYLRFVQSGRLTLEDRAHFLGYTGRVMRSVIVDLVREHAAQRRGGAQRPVTLDSQIAANDDGAAQILDVHHALEALAEHGARLVQVVELRYFAGLTETQIAEVLGVTERTVRRDWEKARLLLAEHLL